jgi:hypothetical protein
MFLIRPLQRVQVKSRKLIEEAKAVQHENERIVRKLYDIVHSRTSMERPKLQS